MKNYWIVKSEPDCYSIDDMQKDQKALWTGIRNYQARNFMRDKMNVGDLVLFYHSSADPTAVVGIVKVTKKAVPEKEDPIWVAPEMTFVKKFKRPVTLSEIKIRPDLAGISVAQKGSRLSVLPLSEAHFKVIERLGL
jgi:predicted RNA-binding protein with PUA-like domain